MKHKLSISVSEKTLRLIEKLVDGNRFRNKSHVVEYSVNEILKGEENDK